MSWTGACESCPGWVVGKVAGLGYKNAKKVGQLRSRLIEIINVPHDILGDRKRWRGFFVRQDPLQGRTAHTKCGRYLLRFRLACCLACGTARLGAPGLGG